jgi:hypothetical protein
MCRRRREAIFDFINIVMDFGWLEGFHSGLNWGWCGGGLEMGSQIVMIRVVVI